MAKDHKSNRLTEVRARPLCLTSMTKLILGSWRIVHVRSQHASWPSGVKIHKPPHISSPSQFKLSIAITWAASLGKGGDPVETGGENKSGLCRIVLFHVKPFFKALRFCSATLSWIPKRCKKQTKKHDGRTAPNKGILKGSEQQYLLSISVLFS